MISIIAELFGLKHDFSDATRDVFRGAEMDLEEINGAEAGWSLPIASTCIIDKTGRICHAVVTAAGRIRPNPNDTLAKLKQIVENQ